MINIWTKIDPYTDKPWKIITISMIASPILSALISPLFDVSSLSAAVIGTIVAGILSVPLSWIVYISELVIHEQNAELVELNYELDAYSHTVAHNIKTTLATIGLSSQLLVRTSEPDSDIHSRANQIHGLTKQLGVTIDSLLLLASVHDEQIDLTEINMEHAFTKAKQRLDCLITKHHPQIHLPDEWHIPHGYEPWIVEVWINLLSNAIKYGGASPVIHVGSYQLEDTSEIQFWIKDNGRGLDADEKQVVFSRFNKLERIQGHGLGLSIVARIVSRLGGTVGVESDGKGLGSTFYFTLPSSCQPVLNPISPQVQVSVVTSPSEALLSR